MTALYAHVRSAGVSAPGLPGWDEASATLAGERAFEPGSYTYAPPELLPRNERRRATRLTRLAFAAAQDALRDDTLDPRSLRSVFASCSGDMDIVDAILRALATPPPALSPMQFHNSVHNAPAGYWSIATGARTPSISLSAHDASVSAGLLEALTWLHAEPGAPVLLTVYDIPPPPPLQQARPVQQPFAAALLLDARHGRRIDITTRPRHPDATTLDDAALENARRDNPAARILPLLAALSRPGAASLALPAVSGTLQVELAAASGR